MKIVRDIQEMQNLCLDLRSAKKRIGFVPTMGALHKGHLSLLNTVRQHSDVSIMSIFVNPTQFVPSEDLKEYPRPFEKDCEKAEDQGCDILFYPDTGDIYPDNYMTYVTVGNITGKLEGASRPEHFTGVTTIVLKLVNIVFPHVAVFGQKDAQQALVVRRMVKDLNLPVELIIAPTIRETDGLALSSRNSYLTAEERTEAPLIYKGLNNAQQAYAEGELSAEKLLKEITTVYESATHFKAEYVAIVDAESLNAVETLFGKTLIAVACRMDRSQTRLIDNIVLGGML